MKATKRSAYELLHEGAIALSQVESNGIRVNTKYLDKTIDKITKRIEDNTRVLKEDKLWTKTWRKLYGDKAKLGNRQQLATILFDKLGYKCYDRTAPTKRHPNGLPKSDIEALEVIDHPFVNKYLEIGKLQKAKSTWLDNLRRNLVDGFLHPSFHLHTARTMRSSSGSDKDNDNFSGSEINFQNLPVRNPERAELIRNAFIARNGRQIFEIDYSGIEVKIAACYHKDKVLIKDILHGDMHRDMAAAIFKLKPDQVSKMARYCSKNMFVFPQFYGSYYVDCAKNLWKAITRLKLCIEGTEISLAKHLAKKGIKERGACDQNKKPIAGTFEHHIQHVEELFWRRYSGYRDWKQQWWKTYLKNGYCDMYTGFRIDGPHRRNDVVNYPIQGAAFHCLLKSLIIIQKRLRKYKMKSLIVGQIHDSLIGDIPEKEVPDFNELAQEVMTKTIPKLWDWITVPLSAEAEVAPVGKSWFFKKPLAI